MTLVTNKIFSHTKVNDLLTINRKDLSGNYKFASYYDQVVTLHVRSITLSTILFLLWSYCFSNSYKGDNKRLFVLIGIVQEFESWMYFNNESQFGKHCYLANISNINKTIKHM